MKEPCDNVIYGGHEKFVWVVVLGGWSLDMVVYEVYTIEAISKYVYVVGVFCVFAKAKQMAYNLTCSMFWNLVSCFANCMLFI